MAEYTTIVTRTISGTGVLRLPSTQRNARHYRLIAQVIRNPLSPYLNLRYYPGKSRYAEITFLNADIVIFERSLEYPRQQISVYPDVSGQTLIAVQCAYKGLLQSFVNLGTALGLTVTSVEDNIADYTFLSVEWDTVVVRCFATTAVELILQALPYDQCGAIAGNPQDLGEFPEYPGLVPSDVGIPVSPAYEDDEITQPADIDAGLIETYTLRVTLDAAPNGAIAGASGIEVTGTVPDLGYVAILEEGTPPGVCVEIGGATDDVPFQVVVAKKEGFPDVIINTFSTCNFLLIVSQEYI